MNEQRQYTYQDGISALILYSSMKIQMTKKKCKNGLIKILVILKNLKSMGSKILINTILSIKLS